MDREVLLTLLTTWNPYFTDPSKGKWVGSVLRAKYLEREDMKMLYTLRCF